MSSNEDFFGLGLFPVSESWFNLEEEAFLIGRNNKPNTMFNFRFYLSADKQIYTRSIYSILDVLKDIGGLL